MQKPLLAIVLSSSIVGCTIPAAPPVADSKNTLTTGQVQLTLQKDVTTQEKVLETFGSPNLVTLNSEGEEVWTYQRNATVSNAVSSSAYGTVILFGGSTQTSGFEQTSRSMTLIIKFKMLDGVKRVSGFSSRSSSF